MIWPILSPIKSIFVTDQLKPHGGEILVTAVKRKKEPDFGGIFACKTQK